MESRITAAVVGCGRMGALTSDVMRRFAPPCWFPLSHAEAIRQHPALELTAFADAEPTALRRAQNEHGVALGFSSHGDLLTTVQPELLTVATRTPGRAAIVRDAMANGVRALHVEKPLCSSRTELDDLVRAFASGACFLTLGAIRRFFQVYRSARDLALSGELGDLLDIRVNMGAGALYWTHPHSVDLILFAAGDRAVEGVQARLSNLILNDSNDVVLTDPTVDWATLQFSDGVAGHITRAPGSSLVLACTKGEVTVESDGRRIRVSRLGAGDPYFVTHELPAASSGPEGTYAPVAELVRCLRGDLDAIAANRRGRADIFLGQRLLFGMVQSHLRDSRLLKLEEADDEIRIDAKTGEKFA